MCANIYQPEVERSIEPGQTQKAFGTDIPVSNAAGNGRFFRAMMRPDTHILVNIFNRVFRSLWRSRDSIAGPRPSESSDAPFSSYNNVVARRIYVCISMQIWYQSNGFISPLLRATLSNNIVAGHYSILSCEIFFKSQVRMCARARIRYIQETENEYRKALSQDKRKEILNCAVGETSVCVTVSALKTVFPCCLSHVTPSRASSDLHSHFARNGDMQRAHRKRYADCLHAWTGIQSANANETCSLLLYPRCIIFRGHSA